MSKEKKLQIRNSTAEFLIFTRQAGDEGIEVRVENETVWLTQKLMAALFEVDVRTVSEHLGNIFASGELKEDSVIRKFRTTAADGKSYQTQFYNLDAIIAVGFRVNSARATQFRQWAIAVLRDFAIRGYVLDKERLRPRHQKTAASGRGRETQGSAMKAGFDARQLQSQRDCVLQPRVARLARPARTELPWVGCRRLGNPNGVVAKPGPVTTPLGLIGFEPASQGSSFLATLGFAPESRWDSSRSRIPTERFLRHNEIAVTRMRTLLAASVIQFFWITAAAEMNASEQ